MTVNKIKAIYFIMFLALATWRVFYNVFLEDKGFSGAEIGIINALIQATVFVVVPVWGYFADKEGIRSTLRIAVIVTAVLMVILGYILNFWILLFFIILLTVFYHPLSSLLDALAVQFTTNNNKHNYGSLRLWGSFGWAISALIGGILFTYVDLKLIFPLAAVFLLLTLFLLRIPRGDNVRYKPHFEKIHMKVILKDREMLVFLVILLLYGFACSPVNAYINLYFKELGAGNFTIGAAYFIQSLSELPFFVVGDRLVKKFGTAVVIIISMISLFVRYAIYTFFPFVTSGLVLCILHGITFSFLMVGVVNYLHRKMPGRHATAQSLLWVFYFGLGHTAGNLIIGILKDIVGMQGVMFVFTFVTFTILVGTSIAFFIRKNKSKPV